VSRTGVLPTDPNFLALCRNPTLLRFTAHWLRKREDDWFDLLSKLLGVAWNREEVERMVKRKGKAVAPSDAFIPLALGCNPQLSEQLRDLFRVSKSGTEIAGGEYQPGMHEEVVELGDLDPEQFKQWAQMATGASVNLEQQREQLVTIRKGSETSDPRIERIREQIAASKRFT